MSSQVFSILISHAYASVSSKSPAANRRATPSSRVVCSTVIIAVLYVDAAVHREEADRFVVQQGAMEGPLRDRWSCRVVNGIIRFTVPMVCQPIVLK